MSYQEVFIVSLDAGAIIMDFNETDMFFELPLLK